MCVSFLQALGRERAVPLSVSVSDRLWMTFMQKKSCSTSGSSPVDRLPFRHGLDLLRTFKLDSFEGAVCHFCATAFQWSKQQCVYVCVFVRQTCWVPLACRTAVTVDSGRNVQSLNGPARVPCRHSVCNTYVFNSIHSHIYTNLLISYQKIDSKPSLPYGIFL